MRERERERERKLLMTWHAHNVRATHVASILVYGDNRVLHVHV